METRREFCAYVSLVTLGAVLEGCGGSPTSPGFGAAALPTASASIVNGAVVLTIDAASPLSVVGSAALVLSGIGSFLVARTAQSTFTALTSTCTHEACTITGFESQTYVCPCHGSQFNTGGAVLSGPAPRSLRQFATQFANNVLTIAV